ncbi:MAG: hypothetical protein K2N21_00870 [Rikenellaceae bacterium]|nr:hypothetical protein [Rikenellaceae bacterium]
MGLDILEEPQVAVLGREVVVGGVTVDSGFMGLGLVESHEVEDILDSLTEGRDEAETIEELDDLDDDTEPDERMNAYDDLCALYDEAMQQGRGLLFTF